MTSVQAARGTGEELHERIQPIPADTLQTAAQGRNNATCYDLRERFDVPHGDLRALTNGPPLGVELADLDFAGFNGGIVAAQGPPSPMAVRDHVGTWPRAAIAAVRGSGYRGAP